jgi:hypothetical protein
VIHGWNLSFACLTGFKAREALRNMRTTDPEFWEELTRGGSNEDLPESDINENFQEDVEFDTVLEDTDADDSDVSMQTLTTMLTKDDIPEMVGFRKSGTLTSLADADNADLGEEMLPPTEANVSNPQKGKEEGRGKRQKFANKRYNGGTFWRHNDNDDWEDDGLLTAAH